MNVQVSWINTSGTQTHMGIVSTNSPHLERLELRADTDMCPI